MCNELLIILKNDIILPLKHYMKGQSHTFLYFSRNLRSLPMKLVDNIFFHRFIDTKTKEKKFHRYF